MLALLLAALEQMIVATALPKIVGELHGLDRMSWAITAYLLTATVGLPVYGKLGDLFGRKGVFQFAIVVFVVGSALAGWSRTMDQLIAFRAIQGVGAGGLMIGVQAIIADIVPPARARPLHGPDRRRLRPRLGRGPAARRLLHRPRSPGAGASTSTCPSAWSPWPSSAVVLKLPKPAARGRGSTSSARCCSAAASTCLVLLTSWGGTEYAWGSRVILGLGAGAPRPAVLFLVVERFAAEPAHPAAAVPGLASSTSPALVGAGHRRRALRRGQLSADLPADGRRRQRHRVRAADAAHDGRHRRAPPSSRGQLISRTGRYKVYPVLGSALSVVGMWLLSRLETGHPPAALQRLDGRARRSASAW